MKQTKGKTPPVTESQETTSSTDAPYDWSQEGTPTGFESAHQEDFGIPFLAIIQKGSPEIDNTHKDYETKKIEGASVGCIFNTVSREILSSDGDPVIVIPCYYQRLFVEWKDRKSGGGFVRQHPNDSILSQTQRKEDGRDYLPNGNLIVTTAYFFGLLPRKERNEGDPIGDPFVIGMTSTQLKKARLWLNMAQAIKVESPRGKITPPLYSHRYALSTFPEHNAEGSWMGWKIETAGIINERELIEAAIETCKTASSTARRQLPAPPQSDNVPI